ncbi:unnamed protein product [Mesocestoides corti]|uniref:CACTA en-spm transposon protein n=1 Tax=Mesocestoides corti TaxID=53468 RepID=A0A158QVL7_MESCO|nr:unnamed protein product [Mesocestoides corti]
MADFDSSPFSESCQSDGVYDETNADTFGTFEGRERLSEVPSPGQSTSPQHQRNSSASPTPGTKQPSPARKRAKKNWLLPTRAFGRHGFHVTRRFEYHPLPLPPRLQMILDKEYNKKKVDTINRLICAYQPIDL